jgi:hypothetical protein
MAESKKQDLEKVIESWRNHVRLIRSRTQLRVNLKENQDTRSDSVLAEMRRIANDAQQSTMQVDRITLFDRDGRKVVSAGVVNREPLPASSLESDEVAYSGFFIGMDGRPKAVFNSRLYLDQELIGSVEVVIDTDDIDSLAGNHRGHGESGETMIFAQQPSGEIVLLHPLRHTETAPDWTDAPGYVLAAIAGQQGLFRAGGKDYRGNDVWAATRYVPDVGWGLVEKVDADEEKLPVSGLRSDLIDLGLALGAFAVAGGTLLGFYMARPIRDLAGVVRRVRNGEESLRADARFDDEVGLLAESLNEYLDHIHNNKNSPDER